MPRGGYHPRRIWYFIIRDLIGRWQAYKTRRREEFIGRGAEFGTWREAQAGAMRWNEMAERIERGGGDGWGARADDGPRR